MRTVLTAMILSALLIAQAESQEPRKVKVAVVNLQRIIGGGINYEKAVLLLLDKTTLEALKKINIEILEVQAQIVDANDDAKLVEFGKRLDFLTRKANLLRQRAMTGDTRQEYQSLLRKFVVDNFKGKYSLILQQDGGAVDRFLWKGEAEVQDITDEVQDQFQKYVDEVSTKQLTTSGNQRSVASR
jgi:hypothetical protein